MLHNLDKLDICARNLGGVQQLAGAWSALENWSDMNERRRPRTGFRVDGSEEEVICPKPRRATNVACSANEFMKNSRRRRRYFASPLSSIFLHIFTR